MESVAAQENAQVPHDPRWEFDAPRFYDFEEGTPAGSQEGPDSWFDTSATKGLATPLDKQVRAACIQHPA